MRIRFPLLCGAHRKLEDAIPTFLARFQSLFHLMDSINPVSNYLLDLTFL